MSKSMAIAYAMKKKAKKMAEGGSVCDDEMVHQDVKPKPDPADHSDEMSEMDHDSQDMVHRILKQYAEGGVVDNGGEEEGSDLADADSADFDYGAEHEEPVSHMESGADSGDDIGDEQESHDREDIVKRILKMKRMKPGHNPKPA